MVPQTVSFNLLYSAHKIYIMLIIDIIIIIAYKSKTIYLVSNHMQLILYR